MKKATKTGLVIGGFLVLGAGAAWLIKRVKSTCNELEKREKQNREVLEQSGAHIDETVADEDQIAVDEDGTEVDIAVNLPKQLNSMISDDTKYEVEAVSLDDFVFSENGASEHVVHISQRYDRGLKRNVLDILFEIPLSAQWSGPTARKRRSYRDGNTCVGNFMSTIRGTYNEELDIVEKGFQEEIEFLVNSKTILGAPIKKKNQKTIVYSGITAYMHVTYEEKSRENDEWLTTTRMVEVPKELYKNNPFNAEHNEITDFICDLREEMEKSNDADGYVFDMSKYLRNASEFRNFRILDAISTIRITLAVQDRMHLDGVNATILKQIADAIYTHLEVEGMNGGVFKYEHFICYVPDLDYSVKAYGYKGVEVEL